MPASAAATSTEPIRGLPPGPRMPHALQTMGTLLRQRPFFERQRRRYGSMFTLRLLRFGNFVIVADPALIKRTFTADARTLHAGEGSPLNAVLGRHSLLAIDEDQHLRQRKLLLPPFKGQRMRAYEPIIEEVAAAELATWRSGVEFATAPSMQRITLTAILRAVFGASGTHLAELERLIPTWTTLGSAMCQVPFGQVDLGPRSPWGRFLRLRRAIDTQLDALIDQARTDPDLAERADVLALMVQATHEDGTPMLDEQIRDQLMTMLGAGHETTAHTLSWAVERLRRHPALLAELTDEARSGGHALREATIREVQRTRPVVTFSARLVKQPFELGGYELPVRTRIGLSANLTHNDPRLFPDPARFHPQRFLEAAPETYSWIPFGGGIRRCIGASFAHMEMDVVLRTLLRDVDLEPTTDPAERFHFRGVAHAPARGGMAVLSLRKSIGSSLRELPAVG